MVSILRERLEEQFPDFLELDNLLHLAEQTYTRFGLDVVCLSEIAQDDPYLFEQIRVALRLWPRSRG